MRHTNATIVAPRRLNCRHDRRAIPSNRRRAREGYMHWLRLKSFESILAQDGASRLRRSLGAFDLVLLGIGAIIGTGIFVLTGVAAADYAGPALVLSFVLSGIVCALAALTYAELAAMVPVAGSAYTYSYAALGEAAAWIVGWNLVLEYAVSAGAVAAGWSGYFTGILAAAGVELPVAWTKVPADGGLVDLPAVAIVLFVTYLLIVGTRESARLNAILVAVKLGALFLFLALAAPQVDPALWRPFMPFGWSGVTTGAAIIFFAYIGFDAVSTAAEETRNPQRDVPIGLIGSLLVCTALYIIVSAVLTGVVPYPQLDTREPVAFALRELGYPFGSALVGVGAIAGISTVLLVLIYGQTRIFFVMARDRLLPESLARVHPKYRTPHVITAITGIFVAFVAGFFPIGIIAELSNIGTLFAFLMVALGVWVLRLTKPQIPRPFRCPAVHIVAPAAMLSCFALMLSLPRETWERFGLWTILGVFLYALYGYRRSPLRAQPPG
jgi:APA family basic amino acid/polyamine antiporter